MQTKYPGGFSVMSVPKLLLHPVKLRIFGPKTAILPQNVFSWAHIGLAGSFGALLVGWLVVVVRGLYLARHLSKFPNVFLLDNFSITIPSREPI